MIIREQPDGGRLITDSTAWGTYRLTLNGNATGHGGRLVGEDGLDYGMWAFQTSEPPAPIQQRPQPPPNRLARPGDWLAAGVKFFTLGMVPACVKCGSRASRMNSLGWPLGILMIFWPPFWMTKHKRKSTKLEQSPVAA